MFKMKTNNCKAATNCLVETHSCFASAPGISVFAESNKTCMYVFFIKQAETVSLPCKLNKH